MVPYEGGLNDRKASGAGQRSVKGAGWKHNMDGKNELLSGASAMFNVRGRGRCG